MRTRGFSLIGAVAATLLPASAFAVDPPKSPPVEAPAAPSPPVVVAAPVKAAPPKVAAAKPAAPPATPEAEPLPEPAVRAWMVATSPQGPWTFRLDNESDKPLRIPADVRLLRFEIDSEPYVMPTEPADPKPKKWAKPRLAAKATTCKLPAPLRPDGFPDASSLLLRPGESYVESFDPRLFCFGKDAAARLAGGSVVHAYFGWEAAKQPAWSKKKAPASGPFVVESTTFPPDTRSLREITAPTMLLHFNRTPRLSAAAPPDVVEPARPPGDAPEPDAKTTADPKAMDPKKADPKAPDAPTEAPPPPPVFDENAPRFELTTTPFVDASSTSRAAVTLTATNVGHRPMLVALHTRMIGFRIDGPDGVLRCSSMPPTHGIPRELFRTIKPGGSTTMTLLLGEGCTRDALRRPGLYRVQATLNANESGSELGLAAFTGKARTKEPSLVRVLSGPDPFYAVAPRAFPTPKRPASRDDDSDE